MIGFGVVGNQHDHVRLVVDELLRAGATQAAAGERVGDVLDRDAAHLLVIATRPDERADAACAAMHAGRDVVVLKPAAIESGQLKNIAAVQQETCKLFSVFFSEHFLCPAVRLGLQMARQGAIGTVRCIDGLGPHRLRPDTRPDWFFDPQQAGGILVDLATHQAQHFLDFADADDAHVTFASVRRDLDAHPGLQSLGFMSLSSTDAAGQFRVDWLTPGGLPTWGDGRLFVIGESGFLEIRKTLDLGVGSSGSQLFITDSTDVRRYDCNGEPVAFGAALIDDILRRSQRHNTVKRALLATALAIDAQELASGVADPRMDDTCAEFVAKRDFTVR